MPRGKWIDKKTATHFKLVYRPQNDPLIHDESAPAMVLNPTQLPNAASSSVRGGGKSINDLASELGSDALSIRANEGEAANHGIYYDDTEYDYMQHMRDIGQGGAVFVEAESAKAKGKAKGPSLEDALRKLDLQNSSEELLDEEILPSKNLQRITYQAQQDVPDAIAGFQPDMDPRLREVLEALEDEAYVEDDDDIFQELAKDARELSTHEFEEEYEDYDEEDEGWESDHTAKPTKEYRGGDEVPDLVDTSQQAQGEASGDWMADFQRFQNEQKGGKKPKAAAAMDTPSEMQSSIWTTTTNGGRKKKRSGAMTNPSNYSMTSSSLFRTEQMSILDGRFEKIEEEYNNPDFDGDDASVSAISNMSSVQGNVRQDFDGMLDEFLDGYSMQGKRRIKKGKQKTGLEQLDEIRAGLGPARLRPSFI